MFGIGIALLGLGLSGAIAINLCGGIVLAGWPVLGDLGLPARGRLVLWTLVIVLVGLSVVEWRRAATEATSKPR